MNPPGQVLDQTGQDLVYRRLRDVVVVVQGQDQAARGAAAFPRRTSEQFIELVDNQGRDHARRRGLRRIQQTQGVVTRRGEDSSNRATQIAQEHDPIVVVFIQ
jgi:hypothetical protein